MPRCSRLSPLSVLAANVVVGALYIFLVHGVTFFSMKTAEAAEAEVDARTGTGSTTTDASTNSNASSGMELPPLGLSSADADMLSDGTKAPRELSFMPRSAVDAFRRDGHVVLPSVFTARELESFRPYVRAIVEEKATATFEQGSRKELNVAYEIREDPNVVNLVSSKRLLGAAQTLLGTSMACVWQDRTVFKDPGDFATHWHRDEQQNYGLDMLFDGQESKGSTKLGGISSLRAVTAWIPLVPVNKGNGGLRFMSGSHKDATIEQGSASAATPAPDMNVGDVSFHHVDVLHGSFPNVSPNTREACSVMFAAAEPRSDKDPACKSRTGKDEGDGEVGKRRVELAKGVDLERASRSGDCPFRVDAPGSPCTICACMSEKTCSTEEARACIATAEAFCAANPGEEGCTG